MPDLKKQLIFLDTKNLWRQAVVVSIVCLIVFIVLLFSYISSKEIKWLRACIGLLFALVAVWFFMYHHVKFFQENPYLILDEIGLKIQSKHQTIFIEWQNVQMIDGGFNAPCIIETKDNQWHKLNQPLLNGRQNLDIILLLKRYAEYYGAIKFIH